jgi:plasmid maintenance system antidote protein VapI
MHNPPHPGEFIRSVYLEPFGMSVRTPEMALRLAKALGRSPESWLAMQDHYGGTSLLSLLGAFGLAQ